MYILLIKLRGKNPEPKCLCSFRITSRINSRDDIGRGLIRDVIRKEPYHIMFIIYLNMRKSCSVLWIFSHVINIILRRMIKGWWYRYQSRQTSTGVMFFQYHICKFPLFSTKYMINIFIILYANFLHYPFISLDKRHLLIFTNLS